MKPKILVVDDETEIRENIAKIFELSNYTVFQAQDGLEALQIAKKYNPDIILSDIMMPIMDGLEMLGKLQNDPSLSTIPVLFLSARVSDKNTKEGLKLGAEILLSKPFDIDDLINNVEIRINKKKQREKHFKDKIEILQSNLSRTIPHEIRTPLNAVLGYSDFLIKNLKKINEVDLLDMLHEINTGGRRLQRILDNFLLYANLQYINNSDIEKQKINQSILYEANVNIEDIVKLSAFEMDRLDDIEIRLQSCDLRISEMYGSKIIYEIIENALKFSQKGNKILVYSEIINTDYSIHIKDKGIGLSQEQIDMIDAYIQFDRKINEQQGTGLGIAIVKKIIEIFGGNFQIVSEKNKFTEVTLTLRMA